MTTDFEQLAARVTTLEELFTHLQHTTQMLSDEVARQGRQLESLQRDLRRVAENVEGVVASAAQRRLEDDKPPHY